MTDLSSIAAEARRMADDDVVAGLERLGGHATAKALCDALVGSAGVARGDVQLAIQRAMERRRIISQKDWTLCLPP